MMDPKSLFNGLQIGTSLKRGALLLSEHMVVILSLLDADIVLVFSPGIGFCIKRKVTTIWMWLLPCALWHFYVPKNLFPPFNYFKISEFFSLGCMKFVGQVVRR